ncbi:hypothetical protein HC891_10030 [Candidatus Gracilibacteria bacterium]|nr:hypothetical protein [Candidatus Gracilibacteria bacterium]
MARSFSSPAFHLPGLIGLSVADSPCRVTDAQLHRLGELLLQQRPEDARSICFVGGSLVRLINGGRSTYDNLFTLADGPNEDAFLIIAGPQGALALLTEMQPTGIRARLFTEPDAVDRAALVLAQFGDGHYHLDAIANAEAQRPFVSSVIAALLNEPALRALDLAGLLPAEIRWIEAAQALQSAPESSRYLAAPAVHRLFQSALPERLLFTQCDADQRQLAVLAAEPAVEQRRIALETGALLEAIHTGHIATFTAADGRELAAWAAGFTVTVFPLLRDGRTWGVLLSASARPLSTPTRATLSGLAALLMANVGPLPAQAATPQPKPPALVAAVRKGLAPAPGVNAYGLARPALAATRELASEPITPVPADVPARPAAQIVNGNGLPPRPLSTLKCRVPIGAVPLA